MTEFEAKAVLMYGLRARGRLGVGPVEAWHDGDHYIVIECHHGVSLFDDCTECRELTGCTPVDWDEIDTCSPTVLHSILDAYRAWERSQARDFSGPGQLTDERDLSERLP